MTTECTMNIPTPNGIPKNSFYFKVNENTTFYGYTSKSVVKVMYHSKVICRCCFCYFL